ncbi:hypothetical protein BD410DRAFT_805955 [Rickenella mellea]|uniref:Uncharacterized protein n=1 Tax=Rickenella mellea TaxID=50990 RepID=A0A4Y7PUU1_9AGAM|nr:hypothetical protein BD410DRAFT_805955 [Rickenella mellea]
MTQADLHEKPDPSHFSIVLSDKHEVNEATHAKCGDFDYGCVCLDSKAIHVQYNFLPVGTLIGQKSDFDRIIKAKDVDPPELTLTGPARSAYRCLFHFQAKLQSLRAMKIINWDSHYLSMVLGNILQFFVPTLDEHFRLHGCKIVTDELEPLYKDARKIAKLEANGPGI